MRCRYIHIYLFIPFIIFALLILSLLIVTLIRAHVAGSSPPLIVARI